MCIMVIGTGSYLPNTVVTNRDIELTDTDYDCVKTGVSLDEWARRQHGGVSRHRVAPGEATSHMATHAAKRALEQAGLEAADVDLIVMATFTSDFRVPHAASMVQANLGSKAKYVQIDAGCSGFVDSMLVAQGLMEAHNYETALVVCADTISGITHPQHVVPLTVFGDGAGAVVLRRSKALDGYGIRAFATGSDGELGDYVSIPGGGSRQPVSHEVVDNQLQYLRFKFRQINDWAVDRMVRGTREAVSRSGITQADVRWIVPHQASNRIIDEVARRLELPAEMFVNTYAHTGNTASASIPIALDEGNRRGLFSDGDWVIMPAAGTGMAWGAIAYRWYDYQAVQARPTPVLAAMESARQSQ